MNFEIKFKMEVTALTLNCWGIAGISKNRLARFEAIATKLNSSKFDFVFLQEVWAESDYQYIADETKATYPFSHYFHSGVIGAGICIFSRSKITDVFFHRWALNGYIHNIHHGDWYGGKGVGLCTVDHHGLKINLYVTHLHAQYDREDDDDEYRAHRLLQAYETSQFINYTRHGTDICILGGDLNANPNQLPYRVIQQSTGMIDSFLLTGQPEKEGTTSETPYNSYTDVGALNKYPDGQRIDYIFYCSKENVLVETVDCCNPLPPRVGNQSFSYSDHEAVCTKLKITTDSNSKIETSNKLTELLEETMQVLNVSLEKLSSNRANYLIKLGFCLILILVIPRSVETIDFPKLLINLMYNTFRVLIILASGYFFAMATMWNRIERNAITAVKSAITTRLKNQS